VLALTGSHHDEQRHRHSQRHDRRGQPITAISRVGVSIPSARPAWISGKFITPGLVDVHTHIGTGSSGITPRQLGFLANLASA
jgi:imidazolonepropionase-like amidohydrolase